MNLEKLLDRAKQIEDAIVNATNQLNALHGHKVEVSHWIEQLKKDAEEIVAPPAEEPVQ